MQKKTVPETERDGFYISYSKGESSKGLSKLLSLPFNPPESLGGGFGGIVVIMTRDIELSRTTLVISGFLYDFPDVILLLLFFKAYVICDFVTKVHK